MPNRLTDLRIVVTGGSRGLGRALVEAFVAEGARVVATATKTEHLTSVLAACQGRAEGVALDLRDPSSTATAASLAVATLGRVDVLVLNAGLLGARAPLADYPMDVWQDVMDVGVTGNLRFIQGILPAMSDDGAIVGVTSGAAGRVGWGAYSLSKLVLEGMMDMLREELAPRRIRCVAINPAGIRTRMRADAYPGEDPATVPHPSSVVAPFLAVAAGVDPGPRLEAREWS
jgi:NAD(P)-dependent dehydrogenase (short-subunit alcohol dehydrogenase family)